MLRCIFHHRYLSPRRLYTEPNSNPMTPPPITIMCFGISFRLNASVELMIRSLSNFANGNSIGLGRSEDDVFALTLVSSYQPLSQCCHLRGNQSRAALRCCSFHQVVDAITGSAYYSCFALHHLAKINGRWIYQYHDLRKNMPPCGSARGVQQGF